MRPHGNEGKHELGNGVAVGGGLLHNTVEVDEGGAAIAGCCASTCGDNGRVPREEVVRMEVVGAWHMHADPLNGHDSRPWHDGHLPTCKPRRSMFSNLKP